MVSAEQFPNEIWLEIFGHLPEWPNFDLPTFLCTLALTCKRFKRISRPLLFTHFKFRPYGIVHGFGMKLLPADEEDIAKVMERLEFWCSDEIAPHVRSCEITPR
ncbi:hypothetical protein C8R45DRAFT_817047, partial [Mycena sanguinolenta]